MTQFESVHADEPKRGLISADGFLANGSEHFHETIAASLEASLGKTMPQVEIRYRELAISADTVVASKEGTNELPTLFNHTKKSLFGLRSSKNSVTKTILHPTTGPGSGKSSFMKALAGVFTHRKPRAWKAFVAYTGQRDNHYHTLTVEETLAFAHQSAGGVAPPHVLDALVHGTPDENAHAKQIIEALYAVYPQVVVKQLGLTNCKDTIVGNAMLRGVSGGERKRVTTGEMEYGMKQVSLMDEISTGLDAAATFDMVKAQRGATRHLKKTIAIALLQPGPEVLC
ncbi:hypothetical protein Ae201684_015594 [Aphanomyces euteiches]|uniref:ABC transporter domain-containing protein n=1 Tax=Aphanomyces euteiches TaxID=100861 RepID=A0A6G0WGF1_9STRA|nr:hypothetical protein Ae201684_015594 [Aphanomyces euteiches]